MTGSTTKALEIAEKIFRIDGHVIPATESSVQLEITYTDGSKVIGEHTLDEDDAHQGSIESVKLIPDCKINPPAKEAIKNADAIIIGPGDLYASLLAVLVVPGMKDALMTGSAKLVYIMNLMTRSTQTAGMTAAEHVKVIETLIERRLDYIILNDNKIPGSILQLYATENEHPVLDDLNSDSRAVRAPLIEETVYHKSNNDTAHRSVLRHNQNSLQTVLAKIL